jgi:hypothetical protein
MEYLITGFMWLFIVYVGLTIKDITLGDLKKDGIAINEFKNRKYWNPKYWILPIFYINAVIVFFL